MGKSDHQHQRKNKRVDEAASGSGSDDDREEEDDGSDDSDSDSVYDSEDGLAHHGNNSDEDDFEDQGSSDEDLLEKQQQDDDDSEDDDGVIVDYENTPRTTWAGIKRRSSKKSSTATAVAAVAARPGTPLADDQPPASAAAADQHSPKLSQFVHTDDLSSDDDDGNGNRIGRVPLHWYDEYDHIGYDVRGSKVIKQSSNGDGGGDRIDEALALQEQLAQGKFVVHDALNGRNVELTSRQLELIRRVQNGAYAHPEHDANPEYIDYFSGVDPEISGLSSAHQYEPKARFQHPSRWEKLQVDRMLDKLEKGYINMDYLTGKIRDMNEANKSKSGDPNRPFAIWKDEGEEEDVLNNRKGPQHIAAPKLPPPGHAASYNPPDEYLPTEEELEQWKEMPASERPHGPHLIPKKFPNLRSVGAYRHAVQEAFERCLDLYLCPRVVKRRLNIDPESLVPRLPQAHDLKPFPTTRCIVYETPPLDGDETTPMMIRCLSPSPDGQFLASGAADGHVRLWEVETGRLLRSWDLSQTAQKLTTMTKTTDNSGDNETAAVRPVVCLEWNPNPNHHCLLAAVGNCVIILATGTAGAKDAELTQALLASAAQGGNVVATSRASKAVTWVPLKETASDTPISAADYLMGPICALCTNKEVASVRWQAKGDYFVSVSPKAGSAAVLIHQLSKGNSQQPFGKSKGEAQLACFHPNKPFLFVASQQHVRIYHLIKQTMAKRLISGCRWISSLDVHSSGDHLIVGSLDRRVIWFDLDLGTTPYKTLKYHERAVRACHFHRRYPLMASASDDGAAHVFHSRVFSDLMRNPLIVPVKILRGHSISNKLGVLTTVFHPTQPWLFTGGADGKIFLYQDI